MPPGVTQKQAKNKQTKPPNPSNFHPRMPNFKGAELCVHLGRVPVCRRRARTVRPFFPTGDARPLPAAGPARQATPPRHRQATPPRRRRARALALFRPRSRTSREEIRSLARGGEVSRDRPRLAAGCSAVAADGAERAACAAGAGASGGAEPSGAAGPGTTGRV